MNIEIGLLWGEFVDFGEHSHSVRTYKGQLELGQRSVSGMEIIQIRILQMNYIISL